VTPDDEPRDPNVDAAYRAAAREEPSPEIDARILAAAHRAVDARPAPVRRSFAQRWRLPVALAATVVLSVTVTFMVYESERAPPLPEPGSAGALREESVPLEKAPGRSDAERNAAEREPAAPRQQPSADELRRAAPEQRAVQPAAPPVAAPRKKDAEAPAEPKRETAPAPAQMQIRSAPAAAPPEPAMSRERALADRPAARGERDALGAAAPARLQTPDEWLAEIRRLKAAGRTDEANRLLAEFRERYADFPIPEDLR